MPTMSFKVSAADARAIKARAKARHKTVSDYLRDQALSRRKAATRPVRRRHPVSGLACDATDGPAVTVEEIHAALADFP